MEHAPITRYSFMIIGEEGGSAGVVMQDDKGRWMKYQDHLAAMKQRQGCPHCEKPPRKEGR